MHHRRSTGALLGAAALALALSGCANPVDALLEQGAESAIEQLAEQGSGTQVDIDAGGGASLPEGWPDIPLADGEIVMSAKAAEGMTVSVQTTRAEADRVLDELRAAGFTEQSTMETGDLQIVAFADAEWSVGLTITPDGESGDAVTMMYIVGPVAQ